MYGTTDTERLVEVQAEKHSKESAIASESTADGTNPNLNSNRPPNNLEAFSHWIFRQ